MQLLEPPQDQIIGVKAFLDILNETLNFAFPAVTIEGEVSSYKVNQGKWVFFDLKDEDATLPCFIPIYQLKVPIEDGMKIRVTGVPKVTKWGRFSLTVKSVSLAGEGALKRAFELLKAKLQQEGLFDASRKRELPKYPGAIGLITSGQSAAYADFIKILGQRWGGIDIQLADVQVQGQPAPAQVVRAIEYFNQQSAPPDVLIIIRGGGSLEDLQAFNTEEVARAIAGSRTPTLVGVGHEVDISLADFAADVRAATPTDAARIVVPDKTEIIQDVGHRQRRFEQIIQTRLDRYQNHIVRQINILERFVRIPQARLQNLELRLRNAQRQNLAMQQQRVAGLTRLLTSYDPTATLKRGYAIVRKGDQVVTGPAQVTSGDGLVVQLAAGNINTKVVDSDE